MNDDSWAPEAAPGAARRRPRKGMGPAAAMGLFLFGALTLLGFAGAVASVAAFSSIAASNFLMSAGEADRGTPRVW